MIGRSPNCDIRIDDQLISKMQSTIKYEDGNWILEDGRDGKESTNGTWYYLNQEQAIQDGMIFKQNQTFFVANFVWPTDMPLIQLRLLEEKVKVHSFGLI